MQPPKYLLSAQFPHLKGRPIYEALSTQDPTSYHNVARETFWYDPEIQPPSLCATTADRSDAWLVPLFSGETAMESSFCLPISLPR